MSALTVAEVLDGAADLLTPEGKWTQGAFARDENGVEIETFRDENPTCFCLFGAVAYVAGAEPEEYREPDFILREVIGVGSASAVADWNDTSGRTQAEVIAKLREAATLAREQQA